MTMREGRRLKILQVVHGFPPAQVAGTEVYTCNLARELKKRHSVSVFYRVNDPARGEYSVEQARGDGIDSFAVNNTFKDYGSFADTYANEGVAEAFSSILDRVKPDVVHIQHLMYLSARLVEKSQRKKIPVVFTLHDYWLLCPQGQLFRNNRAPCDGRSPDACADCVKYQLCIRKNIASKYARLKKTTPGWLVRSIQNAYLSYARLFLADKGARAQMIRAREAFMRELLSRIAVFIAPSEFVRQRFIASGIPDARIKLLDNGFDAARFQDIRRNASKMLRFGFIGNLMAAKGTHILIEAFNRMPPGRAELRIYGAVASYKSSLGNYDGFLKRIAARDNIRFMGGFDNRDIGGILSQIDVLVVPSLWYENSPLVIHEAFMARVPVIASRIGGIPGLVTDGQGGFLFDPGDVDGLAEKMQRVIADPSILDGLKKSFPRVKSIEENALELERIYGSLV